MIDLTGKHVAFCGDIHGDFRELVYKMTILLELHDTAVIVCGDCGFGFEKSKYYTETLYKKLFKRLESSNNELYFIRGNHDDPSFFNGDNKIDLPRFRTISDYETILTDRGKILCIGGASSIDREDRIKYEAHHPNKKVWWSNERLIKEEPKDLDKTINIIISHEAPIQLDPVVSRTQEMPLDIYQNIIKDRDYLGIVLKEIEPDYWFYGHYHTTYSGSWGKTLWHCLNILEIYDFC